MAVFCIANTEFQAQAIVAQLRAEGFAATDVSAVFPDHQGTRDGPRTTHDRGAVTGGLIGGALGWLAGVGALAVPGVGPFLAAGPMLTMLSGLTAGVTVGGLTGALIGSGLPEREARRFEDKLRGGNILLAVHVATDADLQRARAVFEAADAHDITLAHQRPGAVART